MKRPKGTKCRNLTVRGNTIYYSRIVGGERIRFSTETSSWDDAIRVRDLYEARKGIGRVAAPIVESPRFGEFARWRTHCSWMVRTFRTEGAATALGAVAR